MKRIALPLFVAIGLGASALLAPAAFANVPNCGSNSARCTEVVDPIGEYGAYTGHDEPSALFYSNQPGAGTNQIYRLTLPKDPKKFPTPDGLGPTWNFQLHPAFWFGMAMCDTQSAPEYQHASCPAGSDSNIYDNPSRAAPDYIGHHPGTAFMEMQFYPPGWTPWPAGVSCSATQWCAALNIDSLTVSYVDRTSQNASCLDAAGPEPVSFAFITLSGKPQAAPDPTTIFAPPFAQLTPDPTKVQFYNPGDTLIVDQHDTPAGLQIVIHDLKTHQTGSMTTSVANGFRQVLYEPNATSCHTAPYAYHPMYSTSSEHTRVPWAAHSYNIAFSDEIGHFEFCNKVDPATSNCIDGGNPSDPAANDGDDTVCFSALDSLLVPLGGCIFTDDDFDGPEYTARAWAGGVPDNTKNTADPIEFTSPTFGGGNQYDRVAFEADLPRIESTCDRFVTGAGCVNPPPGTDFYPFFTTAESKHGQCVWHEGGAYIDGTTNTFGGSSTTAFGALLKLFYPSPNAAGYTTRYNDFRRILPNNPCPGPSDNQEQGGDH